MTRGLALLGLLLAAGPACASFGANYAGAARDGTAFQLFIDGGAPAARTGSRQTIRMTVWAERQGRRMPAFGDCTYHYNEADRRDGRIVCATRRGSPLDGVVYVRDGAAAEDEMVCVTRCRRGVPARLQLDAEEDNH